MGIKEKDFLKAAGSQGGKSAYRGGTSGNNNGGTDLATVVIVIVLFFLFFAYCVGQNLFRGKKGGNYLFNILTHTLAGSAAFLGLAIYLFITGLYMEAGEIIYGSNKVQFAIATIFFFTVSLCNLFIGLNEVKQAKKNINPNFPGEFTLLGFLSKYGYKGQTIAYLIEPLSIFVIGVLMFAVAPVLGVPVLVTAIAYFIGNFAFREFEKPMQDEDDSESLTVID